MHSPIEEKKAAFWTRPESAGLFSRWKKHIWMEWNESEFAFAAGWPGIGSGGSGNSSSDKLFSKRMYLMQTKWFSGPVEIFTY